MHHHHRRAWAREDRENNMEEKRREKHGKEKKMLEERLFNEADSSQREIWRQHAIRVFFAPSWSKADACGDTDPSDRALSGVLRPECMSHQSLSGNMSVNVVFWTQINLACYSRVPKVWQKCGFDFDMLCCV